MCSKRGTCRSVYTLYNYIDYTSHNTSVPKSINALSSITQDRKVHIVSGLTQYSTVVPLVQQLAGEVRARESRRMSEENCATCSSHYYFSLRTSDLGLTS